MRRNPSNKLNNLWICRKKVGLPQKLIARLLGHRSTSPISEYETGRLLPNLRTAFKLAAIYNVSPTDLYASLYQDALAEVEAARKTLPARREARDFLYDFNASKQNHGSRPWGAALGRCHIGGGGPDLVRSEDVPFGLSDHPKPAISYHLKTGQREWRTGH